MSRSNPYKRKKRYAKITVLIFGEGMNEKVFLKHLRKLYCRNSNVAVTIKSGRGGDSVNLVIDASRILGEFNKKIVFLER